MLNFPHLEKTILDFWKQEKIFEKLRSKNRGKKRWSFFDGPITANNPMAVHHAWGRSYKDIFGRYRAMQGYDQRFQNGFDCQGLWVEVEVEKELGFKNKKDIEQYGIDRFVEKCKERVRRYSAIQTEQSIRLGQWMDWENSYYTMSDENNYTIWHFLKKCWEKGYLYKGRDVVPWCPRCGTAISEHEILTEEYKEIKHKSVFIKFKAKDENAYFLAWTTTIWTLPANVALAVHPEMTYVLAKNDQEESYYFLKGKEKFSLLEHTEWKVLKEISGKDLVGKEYDGIFDSFHGVKEDLDEKTRHKIIAWDEITAEEGTGIVHIAPGCGQEDFQLANDNNLPIINPLDDDSKYKAGFGDFSNKFAYSEELRESIFEYLKRGKYLLPFSEQFEMYPHRYPTCWRCKTELIFRLVDEWYISMEKLRSQLIKAAKTITWIPGFGLDRELDWLKNMRDWLISKKRYWGLALPIFECSKCGNFEVIGSKEEFQERAIEEWDQFQSRSPHRPFVDRVKIQCSKCGEKISRIPDVGNPWLDAGIVPFTNRTDPETGKLSYQGSKK